MGADYSFEMNSIETQAPTFFGHINLCALQLGSYFYIFLFFRRDPTIIQPVAIRRSPDSPVVQSSDLDEEDEHPHPHQLAHRGRRKPSRGEVGYEKLWNAAGKDEHDDDDEEDSVKEHKR